MEVANIPMLLRNQLFGVNTRATLHIRVFFFFLGALWFTVSCTSASQSDLSIHGNQTSVNQSVHESVGFFIPAH